MPTDSSNSTVKCLPVVLTGSSVMVSWLPMFGAKLLLYDKAETTIITTTAAIIPAAIPLFTFF